MKSNFPDVEAVLSEFFTPTEAGWISKRADAEISVYKGFSDAGKRGAAKRWGTGGDSHPITPPIANSKQETLNTNQGKSKDMSAPSAQTAKKGTSLPADWVLPKPWGEWAVAEKPNWTVADIRRVADDFKDHWLANANQAKSKKADWLATWRKWVRSPLNEIKKQGFTGVQDARLEVMNQIWGKSNGTSRQIIDINEAGSIEGNGSDIQENVPFLR